MQSIPAQWKAPFVLWARCSPHWDALIPDYNLQENLNFDHLDN
jgi:hypothetical protein